MARQPKPGQINWTVRTEAYSQPGQRSKFNVETVPATAREIAKYATDTIARSGGQYRSISVHSGAVTSAPVMTCSYGIYRKSERARTARGGMVADRGYAKCMLTQGFKQLIEKPRKKRRK